MGQHSFWEELFWLWLDMFKKKKKEGFSVHICLTFFGWWEVHVLVLSTRNSVRLQCLIAKEYFECLQTQTTAWIPYMTHATSDSLFQRRVFTAYILQLALMLSYSMLILFIRCCNFRYISTLSMFYNRNSL